MPRKPALPPLEDLLPPKDAATLVHVDERTLRRWSDDGLLTRYRVGPRSIRYSRRELQALAVKR